MYTDDLATLEVLTEDAIVDQLHKRYTQNQIYTYIGDILVAVNPFTDVGIYTSKVIIMTLEINHNIFLSRTERRCLINSYSRIWTLILMCGQPQKVPPF